MDLQRRPPAMQRRPITGNLQPPERPVRDSLQTGSTLVGYQNPLINTRNTA